MSLLHQKTRTLVHLLSWAAETQPDRHACSFLKDDMSEVQRWTFSELDHRAAAVGAALQHRCTRGDRVLLLFSPGLDFVSAFLGCLYAGVIAVPLPSPAALRPPRFLPRLRAIAEDSQASVLLTTSPLVESEKDSAQWSVEELNIPWIALEKLEFAQSESYRDLSIQGEDLAYLQYTSGSTSSPKGVMITHNNVMSQCKEICQAAKYGADCISINWMPHFHDFGLVQGILVPLYVGIPAYLMSPFTFLKRPISWLEAISRFAGTHSGGPNFAYEYCVRKTSVGQRASLNLQSWRMASCGAEPIQKETVENFIATFIPYGFRRESFHPGYGLAECTLMVSTKHQGHHPHFEELDGKALETDRIVGVAPDSSFSSRTIVGCGRVGPSTQVAIVNPYMLRSCAPHQVGEIWVACPSVARGYWNRPKLTQETFDAKLVDTGEGPFLRTGDLGFLKEGELFVTGRLKDLIIIHGRNYYPQDIEQTVERSHESFCLRRNVAALSVHVEGEERLVIIQEIDHKSGNLAVDELAGVIRQNVLDLHDLQVYAVVFVKARSIPITTSGKIQRHVCRASYLRGELAVLGRSILNVSLPERTVQSSHYEGLHNLPKEERKRLLERYLCEKLARTLKADLDHLYPSLSLGFLGLDSLMAVEVRTQIERDFGVEIPLSVIFEASTIANLAHVIELAFHHEVKPPENSLVPTSREGSIPLSFAQESFWILNELDPKNPLNTIHLQVKLMGSLNPRVLEKAVNKIVDRHESLRTRFQQFNGQLEQIIVPNVVIPLPIVDLRAFGEAKQKKKRSGLIRDKARQPFDLTEGPLVRVTLVQLEDQEYVLLLSFHHIVSDWSSVGVFFNDLSVIYRELTGCGDSKIPALPIQYADYAVCQRQWVRGAEFERLLSYWKTRLSNAPPMLDFPPRALEVMETPSHQQAGGFFLSLDQVKALKDLGLQGGTTLFMTLVAALFVLLFRYTHQTDLVIGTPAANRVRQRVDALIGVFMNPLALRVDLAGYPTFRDILQRVRQVTLEAYDHQEFPFELLVRELQPIREEEGRTPFFQVLFEVLPSLNERLDLPGLTSSVLPCDLQDTHFDLTVSLLENPHGIEGVFEYNAEMFDPGTVQQMVEHYSLLLEAVAANPDQPITTLPFLSESEERQLLRVWSGAQDNEPGECSACIHELFERQVDQTPEAIAVVHQDERLTYRELNNRANQLAHYLRRLGVGPETLVGLCVGRGWEMVVAIMGILKSGGAYVPLDRNHPKDRMAMGLQDIQAPVVVTQSWLPWDFSGQTNQVVFLDTDWEKICQLDDSNPANMSIPENLAYVFFTSGSTGVPKGIMGTHRGLHDAYWAWEDAYLLRSKCRSHFQMASVVFDVFTEDMVRALCSGGKLVLCPEDLALSPQLLDLMRREKVDFVEMVPATMKYVMGYLEERQQTLDSLNLMVVGADRWSIGELQRLKRFCGPETQIVNSYGVTEATVDSTYFQKTAINLEEHRLVPIGRPMRNTEIYILDKDFLPVPIGVIGELFIGGSGLARCYLNRPDLTAERFIPHLYSTEPGARLYKTGDLARFLPDGNIEFLGRMDHQVKVNGIRVELNEVEHVLVLHPAVRETVAMVHADKFGNSMLVSYVVKNSGDVMLSTSELREFLEERLPAYMVPSAFVFLDALPLTATGKVDRHALLPPEDSRPLLDKPYVAPRTDMERQLVGIWEKVLETTPVGVQDNFFDLGGYSLLAVSLFYQIEKLTGRALPLSTLLHASTIEKLAEVLSRDEVRLPMKAVVPIQPSGNIPPLFVVHLIGGNVLSFSELSKMIGREQPLYGLQSIGLDGQENPIDNIEEMAARYVAEVQLIQPHGPYYLAGGCMGGVVAFEMAQQFRAKGQHVAFLGIVESWLPDLDEEPQAWNFELGPRMTFFIKGVKSQVWILKDTAFKEWMAYGVKKLKVLAQMIRTLDVYQGNKVTRNHDLVLHANERALSTYLPNPYAGKITYFLASGRSVPLKDDPRLKWENYAREGFEVFRIPAPNAGQMFSDPYVDLLGMQLMMALDKAQSEAMREVPS